MSSKAKTANAERAREQLPAKEYQPTPRENRALAAHEQRRQANNPSPRMKILGKEDAYQIAPDHDDAETGFRLVMESFGTSRPDFASHIIAQLGALVQQRGEMHELEFNAMLELAKGVRPEDEIECMLAAQMAAVHSATMDYALRLRRADTIKKAEAYERGFNKLARTFAAQVEALKRYRSRGDQKIVVKHVHVHEGGKAVVGNVSHGGRG